jgi:hypothetical protein
MSCPSLPVDEEDDEDEYSSWSSLFQAALHLHFVHLFRGRFCATRRRVIFFTIIVPKSPRHLRDDGDATRVILSEAIEAIVSRFPCVFQTKRTNERKKERKGDSLCPTFVRTFECLFFFSSLFFSDVF